MIEEELFSKMDSVSDRDELIKLLNEIEITLNKMKMITTNYESNIYEKFGLGTINLLNKELYKQKIYKK